MSSFKENLKNGQNLSFEESKILFSELMEGKYDENSIIEILEAFSSKGETKDELAGTQILRLVNCRFSRAETAPPRYPSDKQAAHRDGARAPRLPHLECPDQRQFRRFD